MKLCNITSCKQAIIIIKIGIYDYQNIWGSFNYEGKRAQLNTFAMFYHQDNRNIALIGGQHAKAVNAMFLNKNRPILTVL